MRRLLWLVTAATLVAACSSGSPASGPPVVQSSQTTGVPAAATTLAPDAEGEGGSAVEGTPVPTEVVTSDPDPNVETALDAIVAPDPGSIVETAQWGPISEGYINILLREGSAHADAQAVATALGGSVIGGIDLISLYQLSIVPNGESGVQAALATALGHEAVELAGPGLRVVQYEEIWGERTSTHARPGVRGDERARPPDHRAGEGARVCEGERHRPERCQGRGTRYRDRDDRGGAQRVGEGGRRRSSDGADHLLGWLDRPGTRQPRHRSRHPRRRQSRRRRDRGAGERARQPPRDRRARRRQRRFIGGPGEVEEAGRRWIERHQHLVG